MRDSNNKTNRNNNTNIEVKEIFAVANKKKPKFWVSNGIQTHDLRDTDVRLYRLSYEASPKAGQVQVQFIPVIWREWDYVYMIQILSPQCYRNESSFWECGVNMRLTNPFQNSNFRKPFKIKTVWMISRLTMTKYKSRAFLPHCQQQSRPGDSDH